ncbi:type III-A CRISPR-associated RAMP protein Csm4 [Fusobacterium animalis]|uniref:type III-A CRISPR-associated RAMP protein Csm4 n=1 Tax=Fusobacterium TaxID=848 RepID=UPI0003B884DF|nr:type III-A CRISPR-associated RAMP protein Csm4 [Fusobacterium nucleatum]ASG31618.1 type III-A CRISPR-associated RAMP protein Csm4 [Fusobacterium animalis]ERT40732.1 CRISPR type III-a/mtube-associated ramp protein csm4 [Fusobacterium nucleatum CTI-1]BEO89280.1 type III-A CRISPR-associated RAMP protein Csm4 [Fusobacterium nucleatum]BEP02212.1 type III-A CRISPR-associated RAMP protein Csm4 [Fusobacterium nucleatum]
MSYLLYKLRFPSGIHIGTAFGNTLEETMISVYSDTFYSALFNEYMKIYNNDELYKISEAGNFLVSDLLPFKEKDDMSTDFYLPKPFMPKEPANNKNKTEITVDRKKVKATNFIPADKLEEYFSFLKNGTNFPIIDDDFGKKQLYTKNKISLENEDTQLYNIEVFKFNEKSGLYFIVKLPENEKWQEIFQNILDSLALTGIGGKRNSGFGQFVIKEDAMNFDGLDFEKFESESDAYINKALYSNEEKFLIISSYSPKIGEIEKLKDGDNYYQLIKRGGFVNQSSYSEQPEKRKQVYMLSSGSILSFKPEGKILDLNLHGKHNIYRMGKPIMLGVKYE